MSARATRLDSDDMKNPGILAFPPARALDGMRFARGSGPAFDEFCAHVLASLPRSDQRRYGRQYLAALLQVEGRKSSRNLSTLSGRDPDEQRLHHFINSSSWDWQRVRRAAASYLVAASPPTAWVLATLHIRKYGSAAAGVERRFVPSLGQTINAQLAVGLWASGVNMLVPVDWTLVLSRHWLEPDRRASVAIPATASWMPLVDSLAQTALRPLREWNLPVLPLVVDARELEVEALAAHLRRARIPVLMRVGPQLPLTVSDRTLRGACPPDLPAHRILHVFRDGRRLVGWPPGARASASRAGLEAAVRVRLSRESTTGTPAEPGDYLLVAGGERSPGWPDELWLTDMKTVPADLILRMGRVLERVGDEALLTGDYVGLRDFSGRSYPGWHRHMTLASAAFAAAALGRPYYTRQEWAAA